MCVSVLQDCIIVIKIDVFLIRYVLLYSSHE